MRKFGHYAGIIFIMFWGLAPFYWMVVTALRSQEFTFDTTPWPTHITLDNFRDALATDKGNDFIQNRNHTNQTFDDMETFLSLFLVKA